MWTRPCKGGEGRKRRARAQEGDHDASVNRRGRGKARDKPYTDAPLRCVISQARGCALHDGQTTKHKKALLLARPKIRTLIPRGRIPAVAVHGLAKPADTPKISLTQPQRDKGKSSTRRACVRAAIKHVFARC